ECWGSDWSGQATAPEGSFSMVAAGAVHSCGVRDSGAVVCWGNRGRLADPPAGSFSAVSSAGRRSCALRADSALACWTMAPVVAAPHGVHRYRPVGQPDPTRCRPYGVADDTTAGFPLPNRATGTGTLRVAVLFVDFPDAAASHTTQQEAELALPFAEERLESSSYGKLDIEFTALHEWLRAEHGYEHYLGHDARGRGAFAYLINEEAIRLADPGFDFTGHDVAMIVMPSSHFGGGNATGRVDTQEGSLDTARINAREERRSPFEWGRTALHELGHNLGLLDMNPYDASRHELPATPAGKKWVTSRFGIMGLTFYFLADDEDPRLARVASYADGRSGTDYSDWALAREMLAWSRWQLGWLDDSQIRCVLAPLTTVSLSAVAVASAGSGVAMAAVPLSDTEVIVIESRRAIGYDTRVESRSWGTLTSPALLTEGVLVYTVDASVESGQLPVKVAGDSGNGQVDDYPILTTGQSVTVHGYTIAVVSDDGHAHTVTITKVENQQAGD
ncbi:MAG: hypothetical protein F4Z28_14970, partial [Gammaproteobacteria bacterium]|nr:hypothetical protein [Gammaproteobacteria bacterium]